LIKRLNPLDPDKVKFEGTADGYRVKYDDKQSYNYDEILHFRINPSPQYPWLGTGYKILLQDVVKSIWQSTTTKNALLENPSPSIVVKVDGLTADLATPSGRASLVEEYSPESGKPWVIPGEMMDVQQVKPLTLADLAIKDGIELDRRAAAMMLGVPPFLVGVGEFNRDEFNNFIRTKVMYFSKVITQELTRQLLIKPEWYFKQSARSLYAYEIKDLSQMGIELRKAGVITGNEVRDLIDLSPLDGLDELVMLENYIPSDRLGDQKKLIEGE
jgi:HK97 family phage portal protein